MMHELQEPPIATIQDAAQQWTGAKRRALQARVALSSCNGSARRADAVCGWSRRTVILGLHALRTGITCVDNTSARGNRTTAAKWPQWAEAMRSLAEPHSHVDPKFPSPFWSTRMTAKAMRQALIDQQSWPHGPWPCDNTLGHSLNRLGYRVRRVHTAKPVKRVRDTEAIFAPVHWENHASDARADALRMAMDTKANLHVGAFSRGGTARGSEAIQAGDHALRPTPKLVPCGILEGLGGLLTLICGTSRDTSDFLAAGLPQWWNLRKNHSRHMRQRVIDLDNGPPQASVRTQCMHRMVACADRNTLAVVLVSSPPYHSTYHPIERCWGLLEAHGNGTFLETVDTVLPWARPMTWTAVRPVVPWLDKVSANGVRVAKKAFRTIEERLERHVSLPTSGVRIQPQGG